MKIRAIDSVGDFLFGKGLQSYNYENNAISQDIKTRILSWWNDCWFDMEAGLDWPRLLGSKNTQTEIELSVRAVILGSYGVLKCNKINSTLDGTNRKLVLSYSVDTIFEKNVIGTVGV